MAVTRNARVMKVDWFDEERDEVEILVWLDHEQPCGIGEDKSDSIMITILTPPRTFAARDELEIVFNVR